MLWFTTAKEALYMADAWRQSQHFCFGAYKASSRSSLSSASRGVGLWITFPLHKSSSEGSEGKKMLMSTSVPSGVQPAFWDQWCLSPMSPAKCRSGSRRSLQSQPGVFGINTLRKGGMMPAVHWPCWQGRDSQDTAGEITLQPMFCWKMPQSHSLKNNEKVSRYFTIIVRSWPHTFKVCFLIWLMSLSIMGSFIFCNLTLWSQRI